MGKEQVKDHCIKITETNRCETHVYLSQTSPRCAQNQTTELYGIAFIW